MVAWFYCCDEVEITIKKQGGNMGGLIPGMLANLLSLRRIIIYSINRERWVDAKDPSVIEALEEECKKIREASL